MRSADSPRQFLARLPGFVGLAVLGCTIAAWLGVPLEGVGLAAGVPLALGYIIFRIWKYVAIWMEASAAAQPDAGMNARPRSARSLLILVGSSFVSLNVSAMFGMSALCFWGLGLPLVRGSLLLSLLFVSLSASCVLGIIALKSSKFLRQSTSNLLFRQRRWIAMTKKELEHTAEWFIRVSDQHRSHRY